MTIRRTDLLYGFPWQLEAGGTAERLEWYRKRQSLLAEMPATKKVAHAREMCGQRIRVLGCILDDELKARYERRTA